jgi:glycosyltransferase involved in cell wall biosynthesis/2-polyprenyl-3-methyl-5-hydroxy-6-metoxy-1,4-benzoquinol methylase
MLSSAAAQRGTRQPRRVLVVGPVPPPLHGVTVMTAALLEGGAGPDLELIHFDTSDHRSIENVGTYDVRNVALALRHVARFTQTLRKTRPDLVYLPLSQALAGFTRDAMFLLAARLFSVPVVAHAYGAQHQTFYRRMPAVVQSILRFSMARVHLIVVLAESLRSQFDGWATPPGGIAVVPNGVRDEWPGGPPQRTPHEGGTVLTHGALIPQKGFLDVLDAVPIVLEAVPATRFVLAGQPVWDEATTAHARAALRRPGVEAATTFAGAVGEDELRRLLETADVVVFAPRWDEGQSLVVIEAMSAGLPVVVTASGGLAETVRDGVEAIVVPRQDPAAIAAAVTTLLRDPALRECMGRAARARYKSLYTLEAWVARMRHVLKLAADGDARSGCARDGSHRRFVPAQDSSRASATAPAKITRPTVAWFSAYAAAFDQQYESSPLFLERIDVWNALLREWCRPGCRVLDAGCGSGALTVAAARTAGEVIAADPSREMLDICARRSESLGITNCIPVHCRIEELGSAGLGLFDVVLCSSVLEYVDDLPACLAVLGELLRPGGTLIASLPNPGSAVRGAERMSYATIRRPRYYGLIRNAPSTGEMAALLRATGFELLSSRLFGIPRALRPLSGPVFPERRVATMIAYVAGRQ